MTRFVDDEIPQLGRGQGVVDVLPNIRVPTDDVDFFTAEFAHDVFHAHPAHAHASANGIDLIVVRQDGDLRAIARFPRDALDLDSFVRDFRDFEFKKFADEIGMAAGKNDLRAVQGVLDAQRVRANAVAGLVFLRGHALPAGHDALDLAKIDDDVAAFEAPYGAGKDIAGATLELFEHHVLLDLANTLKHRLLGGLRGDAAKVLRGDLNFDVLAELRVRKTTAGVCQRDLIVIVDNVLEGQLLRESPNHARLAVDLDAEIARGTDTFLGGLQQSLLDRLEQDFPVDALFALKIFYRYY